MVSNTTEAGIAFDAEDKSFEVLPLTFPGKLTALLYHRFKVFSADFSKGLVMIPCELISISLNSISKFKVRVLPMLLEYHSKTGSWPKNLIISFAALIKFYSGKAGQENIPLKDDPFVLEFIEKIWKEDDLALIVSETLRRMDFWGEDLRNYEGLEEVVLVHLEGWGKN